MTSRRQALILVIDRRRSQVAECAHVVARSSRHQVGGQLQFDEAVVRDVLIDGFDDPVAIAPRERIGGLVASDVGLSSAKRATSIQWRPQRSPYCGEASSRSISFSYALGELSLTNASTSSYSACIRPGPHRRAGPVSQHRPAERASALFLRASPG